MLQLTCWQHTRALGLQRIVAATCQKASTFSAFSGFVAQAIQLVRRTEDNGDGGCENKEFGKHDWFVGLVVVVVVVVVGLLWLWKWKWK